jgi:hypothetical protein
MPVGRPPHPAPHRDPGSGPLCAAIGLVTGTVEPPEPPLCGETARLVLGTSLALWALLGLVGWSTWSLLG